EKAAKVFPDKLIICGGNPGMEETTLPYAAYREMRLKMVVYPHIGLYAAAKAMQEIFAKLQREDHITQQGLAELCCGFDEFQEIVGLPDWNALEHKYTG